RALALRDEIDHVAVPWPAIAAQILRGEVVAPAVVAADRSDIGFGVEADDVALHAALPVLCRDILPSVSRRRIGVAASRGTRYPLDGGRLREGGDEHGIPRGGTAGRAHADADRDRDRRPALRQRRAGTDQGGGALSHRPRSHHRLAALSD